MKYILLPVLLLLSACASIPKPEVMKKATADYNLPLKEEKGMARIYVVRPDMLGGFVRFNVYLDGHTEKEEMGWTRAEQHMYFYLTPGKHTIFSQAENLAEIGVEAKDGEDIFLMQEPSMGMIMARNSLKRIDELEGKYHVMKTAKGEIKKVSKDQKVSGN
jgi:hypothetical protein